MMSLKWGSTSNDNLSFSLALILESDACEERQLSSFHVDRVIHEVFEGLVVVALLVLCLSYSFPKSPSSRSLPDNRQHRLATLPDLLLTHLGLAGGPGAC